MQTPEEFCRKTDIKLRKNFIASLTAVSAAVLAAGSLIYIFAPKNDFLLSKFSGHSCKTGLNGEFLLASSQSYDRVSIETVRCDISGIGFTVTVHVENSSGSGITFSPADLRVYVTDTARGSKPAVCRIDMTESVVIPSASSTDFTVSGTIPDGCNYETGRITLIFNDTENGNVYSIMPD